jgi:DNA-binding CsgD family transcriptional regulator
MDRGDPLLEREGQIGLIEDAVASTRSGDGPLVVVRGVAGIGKTSLLAVAQDRAREAGIAVLQARAGVLEHDLVYGVVAQLLERRVFFAGPAERGQLLAGPARLAEAALRPVDDPAGARYERGALNHGLYWLVANLVDQGPLMLVVDDAQWADLASLQFLLHLARRRVGLELALVLGARSDEPDAAEVLGRLVMEPGVTLIEPPPLSCHGAAQLLARRAGTELPVDAARAGYEVTGGNPFFLGEIGAALRDRPDGRDGTVELVRSLVPSAVRHALLIRLGGLGPDARATAEALAVLGEDATVNDVAGVAGAPRPVVLEALGRLTQAGLIAPDAVTRFVHPIIHTAIYGDLGAASRALLHERSARVVAASGAEPERIANHLLGTEPSGDADDARILAAVGAAALRRGEAGIALGLLERAVAEPPAGEALARVRFDLGCARLETGDAVGAAADLRDALARESDPGRRVEVALFLTDALAAGDQIDDAIATLDHAIAELGGDHALRLRVQRTTLSLFDPARSTDAQQQMLAFASLSGDTPAERGALANAAIATAFTPSGRAVDVIRIARRALADGRLVRDSLVPGAGFGPPIYALAMAGDLDRADEELERVQARARERGSAVDALIYEDMRLEVCRQRGELRLAAAHGDSTLALCREWGDHAVALRVLSLALCWLVEVLVEQGKAALATEAIAQLEAEHDLASRPELAWAFQARGIIALAESRYDDARADFLAVGAVARAVGYEDRTASWRPWAARALAATGDRDGAIALVGEELALCRTWGAPGPLACALRAQAMIGESEVAETLLREATEVVSGTSLALESARVATDLGIVQRRAGQRVAARETLRLAADAAAACGAVATAERARAELVILGARPRRLRLGGVDALTPSEHRVASLAASGLSNRRIAQELFVSAKTVESHLGQVYSKLDVRGRDALPGVLAG